MTVLHLEGYQGPGDVSCFCLNPGAEGGRLQLHGACRLVVVYINIRVPPALLDFVSTLISAGLTEGQVLLQQRSRMARKSTFCRMGLWDKAGKSLCYRMYGNLEV